MAILVTYDFRFPVCTFGSIRKTIVALFFFLTAINLLSLEAEYLLLEKKTNLKTKLVKLLLHLLLCLLNLIFQCRLFVFLSLVSDHLQQFAKILVFGLL